MDLSILQTERPKTRAIPIRPYKKDIIRDRIHPREFNSLNIMYACEDCSFFNRSSKDCAMGYKTELHLREKQLHEYKLTGRMAICRSMEID